MHGGPRPSDFLPSIPARPSKGSSVPNLVAMYLVQRARGQTAWKSHLAVWGRVLREPPLTLPCQWAPCELGRRHRGWKSRGVQSIVVVYYVVQGTGKLGQTQSTNHCPQRHRRLIVPASARFPFPSLAPHCLGCITLTGRYSVAHICLGSPPVLSRSRVAPENDLNTEHPPPASGSHPVGGTFPLRGSNALPTLISETTTKYIRAALLKVTSQVGSCLASRRINFHRLPSVLSCSMMIPTERSGFHWAMVRRSFFIRREQAGLGGTCEGQKRSQTPGYAMGSCVLHYYMHCHISYSVQKTPSDAPSIRGPGAGKAEL